MYCLVVNVTTRLYLIISTQQTLHNRDTNMYRSFASTSVLKNYKSATEIHNMFNTFVGFHLVAS